MECKKPIVNSIRNREKLTGLLGLTAVVALVICLLIMSRLNPDFSLLDDYVSKLGAIGEPYAMVWNILGFGMVGFLMLGFGLSYGNILNDLYTGTFLGLFGLGFALTAIPVDLGDSDAVLSKAHIVAICLALSCWLFGLARISSKKSLEKSTIIKSNIAATILVISMMGSAFEIWSMPIAHRLVFGIVFGWTMLTSIELLIPKKKSSMKN